MEINLAMKCDSCEYQTNDCDEADWHELEKKGHTVSYNGNSVGGRESECTG